MISTFIYQHKAFDWHCWLARKQLQSDAVAKTPVLNKKITSYDSHASRQRRPKLRFGICPAGELYTSCDAASSRLPADIANCRHIALSRFNDTLIIDAPLLEVS